jgi:predicted permease
VSADYFRVLKARLVAGRMFDGRDRTVAPAVVMVNDAFVRRWFPGENPIGRRVDFSWDTKGLQTVIGVIADMKEEALGQPVSPALYIPLAQRPSDAMYLVVRSVADPEGLVPTLRREVLALDPNEPLTDVRLLDDVVTSGLASSRVSSSVVSLFSLIALVLAAIGLYGVVSYTVVQRTPEIGVRMALGARPGEVLQLIFAHGLLLLSLGLGAGAVSALALTRLMSAQLFGVVASDPATYGAIAVMLVGVTGLASLIPALRAAHVDPLVALRQE